MREETYSNLGVTLIIIASFLLIFAMTTHAWSYLFILFSACLFLNGILIVVIYLPLMGGQAEPTDNLAKLMPIIPEPVLRPAVAVQPSQSKNPTDPDPDTDPWNLTVEQFSMGLFMIPPLSIPDPIRKSNKKKKQANKHKAKKNGKK